MAARKDGQRRTDADDFGTNGTTVGRRRVLKLTGAGLLATVGAGRAAAAGGGAGDAGGSGGGRRTARDGPIGGGQGYGDGLSADSASAVVGSAGELESALGSASAGDVVFVRGDATVDLGSTSLTVPAGVTVASNRGADGAPGAMLTTGGEPADLLTLQQNARVTGLRLRGPHTGADGGGSSNARALTAAGEGVEIDNTEIRGFSYAGVMIQGEAHVHHNVITECNKGGLGYGVSMVSGYNTIEYNYMNFNRHSVATDGSHRGYICRYNHFGPKTKGHVIDMHAPAGTRYEIHNNVVEGHIAPSGEQRPAVAVRGVPDDQAIICYNWFWNGDEPRDSPSTTWTDEAVIQPEVGSSWQGVNITGNVYGEDAGVDFSDVIAGYSGWRSD